jgi:hypothetical protein
VGIWKELFWRMTGSSHKIPKRRKRKKMSNTIRKERLRDLTLTKCFRCNEGTLRPTVNPHNVRCDKCYTEVPKLQQAESYK